jgi:signal transduction histidine kinase
MIIQAALHYKDVNRNKLNELLLKARSQINQSLNEARDTLRQLRAVEVQRETGLNLFLKLSKTFENLTGVKVKALMGEFK